MTATLTTVIAIQLVVNVYYISRDSDIERSVQELK